MTKLTDEQFVDFVDAHYVATSLLVHREEGRCGHYYLADVDGKERVGCSARRGIFPE
jgi:hypothetical protein